MKYSTFCKRMKGIHNLKSMKTRMVTLLIASTMLAVMIVGGLSIITANENIQASSTQNLTLVCENNKLLLNSRIQSIKQSAQFLSQSVVGSLDDFEAFCTDEQYVSDYTNKLMFTIEKLAANTEGCYAAYIRYNPEYTEPTSGIFLVYNEETNKFEHREPTDISKYAEDDIEHVGWYHIPVKKRQATWLPPYHNANIDKLIVSYVVPIYHNGINIGVVGMDLDFDFFSSLITQITAYSTGYAFLLDTQGDIMVHRTLPLYTKLIEEDENLIDLIRPIKQNYETTGQYTYNNRKMNFASAKLDNDMVLCISAPTKEIYKDADSLTTKIIIISVVSFIVLIIIAFSVINKIMKLSNIDELTRLPNRKVFLEAFAAMKNRQDHSRSLFILDIDNFKHINDKLGHNCGDKALSDLAVAIRTVLGKDAVVARWGGDEFIGLLPTSEAEKTLEHLLDYIDTRMRGEYGKITISVGLTAVDSEMTAREVTEIADKALYLSKSEGRNRITVL